jgi:hypothetical protein
VPKLDLTPNLVSEHSLIEFILHVFFTKSPSFKCWFQAGAFFVEPLRKIFVRDGSAEAWA